MGALVRCFGWCLFHIGDTLEHCFFLLKASKPIVITKMVVCGVEDMT
jgi:hypothetical protein